MGLPRRLLGDNEHVEIQVRTHAKAMVLPAIMLIALGAGVGIGAAVIPHQIAPVGQYVVIILGLILAIWWCVLPFLRWRTTTYTVTNRRLILRTGILSKTGKDLPLIRVNDVSYARSLSDRVFGCGTLKVQTAGEDGLIELDDIPDVEQVHRIMSELLFEEIHGRQPN
ncbi:PH domain-containing protein [Microlunatus elymi]|uniref:PH domain-containing protein n=1 Tax=Microlunatus elymi TaxID=2596828 RepID=A0A516PX30_9ACTN|nr:PH domain-containing protein [Microlunatus elymi]QDP95712.1 PH domain-containing protein [Microlunatus elymi]